MSDLEGFGFVLPHWFYWGWLAVMPLLMIALDKWALSHGTKELEHYEIMGEVQADEDPIIHHHFHGNWLTKAIDWLSEQSGVFIAFWTINAVCFYFYEVIARYFFNMPTIWVHEASFLLLGMQYMLAGAYALLHGAHVRVDVVYNKLPERGRVGMDIFTSVFFFTFAIAMTLTSWVFFIDSYNMGEVTMETWGIQHWPVKGMMLLGSILILLAGLSKFLKDIMLFIRMGKGGEV
ncbi:MAG: C4-dicarboxylate ABC transporter permease [Candidatus Sedimenticola endophacoides]|uniref:TRAP transporter small permease protein n=1 Tax=Candidatus Sedimenticola endophacoides TaxID=2548426 RepID=A0A657PW01_9GAMM|nr:MAG: C4-dicarboxylate ABC transporter permease [Candidatus Sedimenticola endophacoides]OQX37206.1 MAG: C4-dicarboxylate ABC transporter permease [Candidatus Sedimenticola endophacoides]OQX45872.1 MAG: C4-dicarboxylate ABC transporter permease [Candidatus Sedimenticola endophacoides]OQX46157.1 MAG: C4-dicarboxylate ABC transporter permease [Candidatus Sedimenticola endophacoides]OQX48337.1 MAG: C4-dicarboxylate ABC transporter permease [Candidatus Sedimenticola endophacoides]